MYTNNIFITILRYVMYGCIVKYDYRYKTQLLKPHIVKNAATYLIYSKWKSGNSIDCYDEVHYFIDSSS